MVVTQDIFGILPNKGTGENIQIKRFTISNEHGMEVSIITYGASITSLKVPDGEGNPIDVVLGFDDITSERYQDVGGNGAVVGRFSNFIADSCFRIDGFKIELDKNYNGHHLHGGSKGFYTRIWTPKIIDDKTVAFDYVSEHGEEGYPGEVQVRATYKLTRHNMLKLKFLAVPNEPTPISMTSHTLFNLGGNEAGDKRLANHYIQINADNYTAPGRNGIPSGEIKSVERTHFDFRKRKNLNKLVEQLPAGRNGYCLNYCINKNESYGGLSFVAQVRNTETRIVMDVYSNQPGCQFFTGQHWPDPDQGEEPIIGKNGAKYMKYGYFALETQNYPNAVNVETFPNAIVNPGDAYSHAVVYKFSILY